MRLNFFTILLGTTIVLGALVLLLRSGGGEHGEKTLHVYIAAGLRKPMDAIIARYSKEYGVVIKSSSAGSGELLGSMTTSNRGDLFLAADVAYLHDLQKLYQEGNAGLTVQQILPIAWQRPVIAIEKGNPKDIHSLQDLLREDVRVSLPDADIAAIGRVAKARLGEVLWQELWESKHVGRAKVTLVAGDIEIGAVDAGIVWDATASQYPDMEMVALPEFDANQNQIAIGLLSSSKDAAAALHFAQFIIASDRGLPQFEKHGYHVVEGVAWAKSTETEEPEAEGSRP